MNEANILARLKANMSVARKIRKNAKHKNDQAAYTFFDGEAHGYLMAISMIEDGGSKPKTSPNAGDIAGSVSANGSVATRTIADDIAEYKATRGTATAKLLDRVLDKLITLKCNHCGKDVRVEMESH